MKKIILLICLVAFSTHNLLSQKNDEEFIGNVESGYINVNEGKLYYEKAGNGDWVVLVHDGVVHREIWDEQFPILAKNYKVIRYDRRGYGKSPTPKKPYSNIDDLYQLFIELGVDKAIIFGMSAGGGMVLDFALKHPEKVAGLVLVGAVVRGYDYSSHMVTRGGRINSYPELTTDPQKCIKHLAWDDPYEIYQGNRKAKEKLVRLLEDNPININMEKFQYLQHPTKITLKYLNDIKVRTLILVGEYDIPDVHAHSGVIQTGITNSKRRIIPNAGHLIPMEQPEAFNESVKQGLKSIEFYTILNLKGVASAVKFYHDMQQTDPKLFLFDEGEMNILAYGYIQNGKVKDAIELFKLNVIAYPNSSNVYDSLGEGYMKDGQTELATRNYEKSLELNPNNNNAKDMLTKLRKK